MQIPNAQKRQSSQQCRLALLGHTGVKDVCRMLMKLTPGVNFTKMFMKSFYAQRSQKRKNSVKPAVASCAFGTAHT